MDITRITIKKGLNLPITGRPAQDKVHSAPAVTTVGLVGSDYIGLKPTMFVEEGSRIKLGQPLFEDKRTPGVIYTAPAAGTVVTINRGARRVLQSVVIRLDGHEEVSFEAHDASRLASLPAERVREQLLQSGLWTALRTRPYSKVPQPASTPAAIFVTAMDSNPLAPDPEPIIQAHAADFSAGLTVLSRLTQGEIFVCRAPGARTPAPELEQLRLAEFAGPHPAGLPGTHIHFLKPVGVTRTVWHIGYQDVIAVGKLFTTGRLWTERVIALAGPLVKQPRLIRTRVGANIEELIAGQIHNVEGRALSGSVFNGRSARGWAAYLSPYHNQITVLGEGRHREMFGWIRPGVDRFSKSNVFFSALRRATRTFGFTTTTNGSPRAMVPIGNYESVMPLDILPTQLLRYLLVKDTETAQKLGALELDEEDLALCSYVCVGKYEFGPVLRENLEQIEAEG
ncbi:MAG: Na(+)-translocating NADH-quinone reductase subunit A [Gammaproteobacteria bacterium]